MGSLHNRDASHLPIIRCAQTINEFHSFVGGDCPNPLGGVVPYNQTFMKPAVPVTRLRPLWAIPWPRARKTASRIAPIDVSPPRTRRRLTPRDDAIGQQAMKALI